MYIHSTVESSEKLCASLLAINSYKRNSSTKDRSNAMLEVLKLTLLNNQKAKDHLLTPVSKGVPANALFVSRIIEKGEPDIARIELNNFNSGIGQRRGLSISILEVENKPVVMLRNPIHSTLQDVSMLTKQYVNQTRNKGLTISDSIVMLSLDTFNNILGEMHP